MRPKHFLALAALVAFSGAAQADLLMTEIVDGPLPGGQPKWVELTNTDASGSYDMTLYSFGNFNNGGTNLSSGSAKILTGVLDAGGSYIISYEGEPTAPEVSVFESVYGFAPDFFMGGGYVNGDDVLALFLGAATGDGSDATMVDVYGVLGVDGSGESWEYTDAYSYRCGDSANGGVFDEGDWVFGGANALEAGCGGDDACEAQNMLDLTTPGVHVGCTVECSLDDPGPGTPYCCGMACPCGADDLGAGCANTNGAGAVLTSGGSNDATVDDLAIFGSGMLLGEPCQLFSATQQLEGGAGAPFGDGLRCTGVSLIRHSAKLCDAAGAAQWTNGDGDFLAAEAGALPGDTRQFQIFYRNVQSTCGAGFNTSNATEVTFGP
ncbi:MAG: hypothetical protein VYE81_01375 [Planctomycetota bacterium]|nr:hypothetical protein [Planctomycetota bacterium]